MAVPVYSVSMPSVYVLRATSCLRPPCLCLWLCPWLALLLLALASHRYSSNEAMAVSLTGGLLLGMCASCHSSRRPPVLVVSHTRQIRFSSCKQRIHFSAVALAGRRSRPHKNTCRVLSLNPRLSSVLLRQRSLLSVCRTTCRYCFVRSRAGSCSRLAASNYASKIIIFSSAI